MTPQQFIDKWQNTALKERAAAQEHFLDLCNVLGEPTPADVDPTGKDFGFEVGASKTTGGNGFADVFKRGCFGWEYKGTNANLDAAFAQLQRYAIALDNPPLLIVSDIGTVIRIHTNWTNSVSKVYEIAIADLNDTEKRGWLKAALSDPEALRPKKTRQELTEEVAGEFARLARSLRGRGHPADKVAHFINRLVFCMFAEDVKLLPDNIFTRMLERALEDPSEFEGFASHLFATMKSGGHIGFEKVAWFNGGLFDDDLVFPLTKGEIKIVHSAAMRYWGDVDPSILGTLFERGLDPDKRSQLGAHYTDRDKIMMIVTPVIIAPLLSKWREAKTEIEVLMDKAHAATGASATRAKNRAQAILDGFLKRLTDFRVLDPACGSGNFLYLALRALKDMEHMVQVEAEALGLPRGFPRIGPEVVRGIELNPYAAELARVSVWVGEIQWMLKNGFAASTDPILKPLNNIQCADALMTQVAGDCGAECGWVETAWPKANAIIGNPPFLGSRKMQPELGEEYTAILRRLYKGRVPRGADLVCYWFAKSEAEIAAGNTEMFGLVATNSIAGGANRGVLEQAGREQRIFAAWRDEPWTVEGAAVRVAIVCIGNEKASSAQLDDLSVPGIQSDLHPLRDGTSVQLVKPQPLARNQGISFQGVVPRGSVNKTEAERLNLPPATFVVPSGLAREYLSLPLNPNGRPNSDVILPYIVGEDITARPRDRFIVDFRELTEDAAALYEKPYEYITPVRLHRAAMAQPEALQRWWLHWRSRPELREAISSLERFIVTARVAKHRIFVWRTSPVVVDNAAVVVARDDDTTFGILQSRFHEVWSLRMGTRLGKGNDPRYTPTTTFETFPFPNGLTPDIPAEAYAADPRAISIAAAAVKLNGLRENWLNPADLVRREPDVVSDYPDRILPIDDSAVEKLKKRTLTNLYNERPAWLQNAHRALDEAVAAAYGWPADLSDDEVLERLFALNQQRAAAQVS